MKPTFLILPVIALLMVGGWFAAQRRSIARLDKESALLRTLIANARASSATEAASHAAKSPNGKPSKAREPIDWKSVAARMEEMKSNEEMGDIRTVIQLQQRVQSMTKEELVAALDEIAKLDLTEELRLMLEQMLLEPLLEKDPELALHHFADRLQDLSGEMSWQLANALGKWAEKDPGKATVWFDEQIAAGKFDSKTLDGKNQTRILFEGEMIRLLVGSDRAAAEARLAKLPEDQWKEIFQGSSASKVKEHDQKAFADLVRGRLPEKETNRSIALVASNLTLKGYPEVGAYLDRIAATPGERAMSVETAAKMRMMQDAHQGVISREEIDRLREWVTAESPGTTDSTTGKALAGASGVFNGKFKFADAAALALHYQESSGNDDVLVSFLGDGQALQNKEEAIKLAEKISDPARRAEVLKKLN
ncbi:MAG: hypothetical protein V4689_16235 [Verrucomicrobiota bacterium]